MLVVVCLSVVVVVGVVVSGTFSFTTQNFFFPSLVFFLTAFFLQRGVVAGVVTGVAGVVTGVAGVVTGVGSTVVGCSDVLGCSRPFGQPWKNPLKGLKGPRKTLLGWFPSCLGKPRKDPGKPCGAEGSPLAPGPLLGGRAGKLPGKPWGTWGSP